jgi:hypothetical protein
MELGETSAGHKEVRCLAGGSLPRRYSSSFTLDLLFELNIPRKRYDLREDRLQDAEHLKEGVCVSFHPFFGLAEDC